MLVVGPKEAEAGTVSVRHRSKGDLAPSPRRSRRIASARSRLPRDKLNSLAMLC